MSISEPSLRQDVLRIDPVQAWKGVFGLQSGPAAIEDGSWYTPAGSKFRPNTVFKVSGRAYGIAYKYHDNRADRYTHTRNKPAT